MSGGRKESVLFLCTANAARSQMAEHLLRHMAPDRFDVFSAGVRPTEVHPLTHRVLNEAGIATNGARSKSAEEFLGKVAIAHAIIVCEKAQRSCPRVYPFALKMHYWPFEDPAAIEGSEEDRLRGFRAIRDQIRERIESWLKEEGAG